MSGGLGKYKQALATTLLALVVAAMFAVGFASQERAVYADVYAEYERADELLGEQDFEGAWPLLERVAEAHPDSSAVQMKLSACAMDREDYAAAAMFIERAATIDPTRLLDRDVCEALAYCYDRTGMAEAAASLMEAADMLPAGVSSEAQP